MTPQLIAFPRHRFPAEIISRAVWLYHVFSLHDIELILAERGAVVTHCGGTDYGRCCAMPASSFGTRTAL